MLVPNRHGSSNRYRYGFQGQEKDDELKGEGNSLNYTFRMHDPRIGRFFARDPLEQKYPHYSPYSFSGNKVIHAVELEGLEEYVVTTNTDKRLRHFKVRPDDNLSVIAKITGVAVNDIIKWNEKSLNGNPDLIYPGQALVLFDAIGLTMEYFVKPIYEASFAKKVEQFIVELATTNERGPSIQSQAEVVLIVEGGAGAAELVINSPKIIRGLQSLRPRTTTNTPKAPVTEIAPKISNVEYTASGSMKGKRIGHTYSKHGSHNTDELLQQAKGSNSPQGQWIDDVAAEEYIFNNLDKLKNGAKTIELPKGLGRVVNPDGTFTPATHVRLVPSGSGVKTAYPGTSSTLPME